MRRLIISAVIVLGATLIPTEFSNASTASTVAPDRAGAWGGGLGVGPNLPSPVDAVEDELGSDIGFAGWIRYHFSKSWQLALHFERLEFKKQATSMNFLSPSLAYRFDFDGAWRPYLGVGVGYAHAINFPRSTDDQHTFGLTAVGGVDYFFRPNFAVTIEVTADYIKLDGNRAKSAQTTTPMIGLTYYFGESEEPEAPKAIQKVVARSADSDGDGVPDRRDACPGTPRGVPVNKLGCELKKKIELTISVEFETNSDVLREPYFAEVGKLAELLLEHPEETVVIEGHTDGVGSRDGNLDLSMRRASSVVGHLVTVHGIAPNRLKAVGLGPDRPIDSNDTPEGRARNRRVIVVFSNQ